MDDYQLLLEFTNGELGLYDCKPLLDFGVFKELQDIAYFKQVTVLHGSVSWPHEQDVCPDTLYLDSEKMDEISAIWYQLMVDINSGNESCSSEKSLVFHFALKLKEFYQDKIKLDFEVVLFDESFSDGKFVDLYAKINHERIGFEFKLPNSTNDTKTIRIKIINDIKRLCYLKDKTKIDRGYFLGAVGKIQATSFINEENKKGKPITQALDFKTHHGANYIKDENFPIDNTKSSDTVKIPQDIVFNWNGVFQENNTLMKFMWLTPIIIN